MSLRLPSVRRSTSRVRQDVRARRSRRLGELEGLEGRVLLSANPTYYTVNLTSDTGANSGTDAYPTAGTPSGDLLWAVTQANANTNAAGSVIEFDPTVFATPQTITLSSTLVLSESAGPEVIDGPSAGVVISGSNAVEVFQVDGGVTATLAGLTISGGSATYGGGIDNGGTLTVTGSTITGDAATYGGGVYNQGTLSIIDSNIADNSYDGGSGIGIYNLYGAVTLVDSTIQDNTSASYGTGGGIYNYDGTLTISSSTITGNSAGYNGIAGGIYNGGGTATITESTIADNLADEFGGGISNGGTLTAVNSTIAYNQGAVYGNQGGLYEYAGATATLYNSILAANGQGVDDIAGAAGSVVSGQYDLVGVDNTGSLINGTNGNLVIGTANPGLGLLAYNGGPTQTIALLAGSPAINAGSNALANEYALTTDQRGAGFPRIVDGVVDIGAYERAAPSSTTLASSPNPSMYGQTITLTATVTAGTAPTVYTVELDRQRQLRLGHVGDSSLRHQPGRPQPEPRRQRDPVRPDGLQRVQPADDHSDQHAGAGRAIGADGDRRPRRGRGHDQRRWRRVPCSRLSPAR